MTEQATPGKFKLLVETFTFAYVNPELTRTKGTCVSHQLIEFDTKAEAEFAFTAIPLETNGSGFNRNIWRLYPR